MIDVREEFRATQKVLAAVVERLLAVTGADVVEISEANLEDSPDLTAWRDSEKRAIFLRTTR